MISEPDPLRARTVIVSSETTVSRLGAEHDAEGRIDLDRAVLERNGTAEEVGHHVETRPRAQRIGIQAPGLADAGVPLGGRAEVGQVLEHLGCGAG